MTHAHLGWFSKMKNSVHTCVSVVHNQTRGNEKKFFFFCRFRKHLRRTWERRTYFVVEQFKTITIQ